MAGLKGITKVCLSLSLLFLVTVEARYYIDADASEMRDVRSSSQQIQQSQRFPAFPDDDQQNTVVDEYQSQDANLKELELLKQQQQQSQQQNQQQSYNNGLNGNKPWGNVVDESQFEYVTQKAYETEVTPRVEEEHVPWYKKVGNFAKQTYKNLKNKIRGERGYYY